MELANLRSLRLLDLHRAVITDAALAAIGQMESLEELKLSNNPESGLTDAGLAYLSRLPNLKRLWTMGSTLTPISDAGFESLSRITSLQDLQIACANNVTDTSLGYLCRLPRLESFSLLTDSPHITDESLARLGTIKTLRLLNLACNLNQFTTSGVNRLNGLSHLEKLMLRGVRHDDAVLDLSGLIRLNESSVLMVPYRDDDLKCFAGMTSLRRLQCINGISDAGLAHLAGLTELQLLNARGPELTDDSLSTSPI